MMAGPVQHSWAGWWGWWHGPHASQAWPLTGTIPGVPAGVAAYFPALRGLSGSWGRPLQEYVQVSAVGVPVTWSVDSTIPPASGSDPLLWQSANPIIPVARLTDSPSLALLQNLLVIFAVAFGITVSMVASLLFEWLRRRPREAGMTTGSRRQNQPPPITAVPSEHPGPASRAPARWAAVAGAVIVIGYARSRFARSRHGSGPRSSAPER